MARHWKGALAILAVFLIAGAISFPALLRSILRMQRAGVTEEQARRQITRPQISTPSDVREKAHLFWIAKGSSDALEPSDVDLALSADPVQRTRQLLTALIAQPPTEAQRTLPADTELLGFYLLPDGTAIADLSEAAGTMMPSGILSEKMAVDSILYTLAANVPAVHSLKILIHGQETDTLAGHLDLTGVFPVPTLTNDATTAADSAPPEK